MNVLSLFDGISGARIALDRAGVKYNKYFASEIDKYAIKIAMTNYPDTIQLGDVTKIDFSTLPKIDLLCAGFPCQNYSVAGNRTGINGESGHLVNYVFKAVTETKPINLFLENVKGIISSNKGEDFKMILLKLNEIGYAVDFHLVNSALVSAQKRERVYIVGRRLDMCNGKIYNIPAKTEVISATCKKSRR